MKKYILNLATALLFGAGLVASSCSSSGDDPNPTGAEPNFPGKVTPTIGAGQTYTLEIEPNANWEISIPTSGDAAKWFWIQDGSQKAFSLRGGQGKHSVVIATLNQPDYDNHHSCEVTMKMKGTNGQDKAQVIATITIGKLTPEISVYTCQIEDGDVFLFNPEYDFTEESEVPILKYAYNENPTSEVELVWPHASNNYSLPILVKSNFDWAVIGNLPEWLSDMAVSSGKAGEEKELRLLANLKKVPAEGAEATINLGDQNKQFPITVKVPGYSELFKSEYAIESLFNALGEYYNVIDQLFVKGNAYGQITSAKDLKFMVFEADAANTKLEYKAPGTSWVTCIDTWDKGNENKGQNRRVEFKVTANRGKARQAIVLGVPAKIADATTPDQMIQGNDIAEAYKKYHITEVKQMEYYGIMSPKELPGSMLQSGSQFTHLPADAQVLEDFSVTGDAYKLVFTTGWASSASPMIFERLYTEYKCYDYNRQLISKETSWLSVEIATDKETNQKVYMIKMDPTKDLTGDASQSGEGVAHKGYIVFSDAAGNFVVVECVYDELFQIPLEDPTFYDPTAAKTDGSSLAKLTSGSIFDQYASHNVPVWHLTYTKSSATMSMIRNLPKFGTPQDKNFLTYSFSGTYSVISMTLDKADDPAVAKTNAVFLYMDQNKTRLQLILVCTLKLK